jgi:hypothetical protein
MELNPMSGRGAYRNGYGNGLGFRNGYGDGHGYGDGNGSGHGYSDGDGYDDAFPAALVASGDTFDSVVMNIMEEVWR